MIVLRAEGSVVRSGLIEFIKTLPNGIVMAEIGCYAGESSELFAQKVSKLYCIDTWMSTKGSRLDAFYKDFNEAENAFDRVVEKYPNKIIKLKGTSLEYARWFKDSYFDLVYIDADHGYEAVCVDIKAWLPKIKKTGIISGHDYTSRWGGVRKAVLDLLGKPDKVFPDTTWVKKL